jgi:hypothetical protein
MILVLVILEALLYLLVNFSILLYVVSELMIILVLGLLYDNFN